MLSFGAVLFVHFGECAMMCSVRDIPYRIVLPHSRAAVLRLLVPPSLPPLFVSEMSYALYFCEHKIPTYLDRISTTPGNVVAESVMRLYSF